MLAQPKVMFVDANHFTTHSTYCSHMPKRCGPQSSLAGTPENPTLFLPLSSPPLLGADFRQLARTLPVFAHKVSHPPLLISASSLRLIKLGTP